MAGIYLIWTGGMFANDVQVQLDDEWQGLLEKDRYAYGLVPPGAHTLGYKAGCQFTAEPGRNYFFHTKGQSFAGVAKFVPISEAEGQAFVTRLKPCNKSWLQNAKVRPEDATVLMKVELPASMYPLRRLEVLNLDTKTFVEPWRIDKNGWVSQDVPVGRYLVGDCVEEGLVVNGLLGPYQATSRTPIRCQVVVSKSNAAIFYGIVSPLGSAGAQIKHGINASVREYFQRWVSFKRPELIEGEITPEPGANL